MDSSRVWPFAGVAVVALVIGLALGSILLPTATLKTSTTSLPVVTVTLETVGVYVVVPYCTTVSGRATTAYSYAYMGETTTTTYLYPASLPSSFSTTVVTASTVGAENHTQFSFISC